MMMLMFDVNAAAAAHFHTPEVDDCSLVEVVAERSDEFLN